MTQPNESWHQAVLELQGSISNIVPERPELAAPPDDQPVFELTVEAGPSFAFHPLEESSREASEPGSTTTWRPEATFDDEVFEELPHIRQLVRSNLPNEYLFEEKFDHLPVYVLYERESWWKLMMALSSGAGFLAPPGEHPSVRPVRRLEPSWQVEHAERYSLEEFNLLDPVPPVPEIAVEEPHVAVKGLSPRGLQGVALNPRDVNSLRVLEQANIFMTDDSTQYEITGDYNLWIWSDGIWTPT